MKNKWFYKENQIYHFDTYERPNYELGYYNLVDDVIVEFSTLTGGAIFHHVAYATKEDLVKQIAEGKE